MTRGVGGDSKSQADKQAHHGIAKPHPSSLGVALAQPRPGALEHASVQVQIEVGFKVLALEVQEPSRRCSTPLKAHDFEAC